MKLLLATVRTLLASIAVCCVAYTLLVFAFAQLVTPVTANGHLIRDGAGTVIGSSQIAQAFTQPRYFWPRPSAVDYNSAGAAGSNLSPTNPKLTARAEELVTRYGATAENPLPADLVTASGAGLDPHISLAGARYQAARVAAARSLPVERVEAAIDELAFQPGGPLTPDAIVNVLQLNLAVDMLK